MKNLKKFNSKALSRNDLSKLLGGFGTGEETGYQCCNQWGCGKCVTGSNEDCSVYSGGIPYGDVWGQSCTPEPSDELSFG